MLLYADNFDLDRDVAVFSNLWAVSATYSNFFPNSPGAYSGLAFGNLSDISTKELVKPLGDIYTTFSMAFHAKVSAGGILTAGMLGNKEVQVKIEAINAFLVKISIVDDGTEVTTYYGEFVNQWRHIELSMSGTIFVVRVNTFIVLTATIGTAISFMENIRLYFETDTVQGISLIDNLVLTDGEVIGDIEVIKSLPYADGERNDWDMEPNSGTHFSKVNEEILDNATYLSATEISKREVYRFNAFQTFESIEFLGLEAVVKTDTPIAFSGVREGSLDAITVSSVYSNEYSSVLLVSPNDPLFSAPWLSNSVLSLFGLETGSFTGKYHYLDLVDGVVDADEIGIPMGDLGYVDKTLYQIDISNLGTVDLKVS